MIANSQQVGVELRTQVHGAREWLLPVLRSREKLKFLESPPPPKETLRGMRT